MKHDGDVDTIGTLRTISKRFEKGGLEDLEIRG